MSIKGEKYTSKKAMKKHEGSEGRKEMMMEYGKVKKKTAKRVVKKSTMVRKKGM